jgi:AcrR family transcriptional regulator
MQGRRAAAAVTRQRILGAARQLLLSENVSEFTMEAVARAADVSRLTIYYQFESKAGLLEALYDYIAKRGHMENLAEVFRQGNDGLQQLHNFIEVFARFWASDRAVIRRLHAMGVIDAEIGKSLRARNERRRQGLRVLLERYSLMYRAFNAMEEPRAVDTLHMLTSFETFDALAAEGRKFEEVLAMIRKQANHAIGFIPPVLAPRYR